MSIRKNAGVHVPQLGSIQIAEYYNWIVDVFEFMETATRLTPHPMCPLPYNVRQVKLTITSDNKWFLYTNPVITPSSFSEYRTMRRLGIKRKSRRPVSIRSMEETIKQFQSKEHFSADVCSGLRAGTRVFTIERKL